MMQIFKIFQTWTNKMKNEECRMKNKETF